MIDLPAWADRLRDQVPFKAVGFAGDLAQALEIGRPPRMPAAFLYETAYTPEPAVGDNFLRQAVDVEFAILMAIDQRNRRDTDTTELNALRQAVFTAWLGWTPDADALDVAVYEGGGLEALDDGVLWWRDSFSTRFILEAK